MTTIRRRNPARSTRTALLPAVLLALATAAAWMLCAPAGAQTENFAGWEETPGLYFYLVQSAEAWKAGIPTVLRTVTRDRVYGLSALRLDFPDVEAPAGVLVYRPPGYALRNRLANRGIVFWVKGDGSKGRGVIAIGQGKDTDPRAFFLLSEETWQPVRLRWSDFDRPFDPEIVESFTFGITPETKRPAFYLIDRISLVRDPMPAAEDDELRLFGEKAAKLPEVPHPTDLSKYVKADDRLAPVLDLLKEKKPVRVLVIGDSLTQGEALWNVPDGVRENYLYRGRLRAPLGGDDPDENVRVVVVATPVEAAERMPVLLDDVKPQLVILEFSSSAIEPGALGENTRNRAAMARLIDDAVHANATVLAVPVPALSDRIRRMNTAGMLAEAAAEKGIALADFGKLTAARGEGFQGEYYATPSQLNIQGHWLLADLLTQALGESKPQADGKKAGE